MGNRSKRTDDNKRIDAQFKVPIRKAGEVHEVPVSLSAHELARIDDWIVRQRENPPRSEAVRILVAQALDAYDIANRNKRR